MRWKRLFWISFHLTFWIAWFVLPSLFLRPEQMPPVAYYRNALAVIPYIAFGYLNSYYVVPGILYRRLSPGRKTFLRVVAVLAWLASSLLSAWLVRRGLYYYLYAVVRMGAHPELKPVLPLIATRNEVIVRRLFAGIFVWAISGGFAVLRENLRAEKELRERENALLQTELSFLRSQVNPHFLRNVLNSMVLLARRRSDQLESALGELAGLLDYMLYESAEGKVLLEDEFGYLQSYIDLQMLRFGADIRLHCKLERPPGPCYIEPMLLIPLVENAFKHGVGLIDDPEIWLSAGVNPEQELYMEVRNKYKQLQGAPGIGLTNLRKRLHLIYPGQHTLSVQTSGEWYITSLTIHVA